MVPLFLKEEINMLITGEVYIHQGLLLEPVTSALMVDALDFS